MKPDVRCVLSMAAITLTMACSTGPSEVAGGGSVEVPNGLTASVRHTDGTPAKYATVRLRRSDWVTPLPGLGKAAIYDADAVADDSCRFQILGIDPGSYRIEVSDSSTVEGRGGAVLFACTLDVSGSLDLGIDTLRSFATVIGMADTGGLTEQRYVQVAGLQRLVAADASGRYSIANLPAGVFDIRALVARAGNFEVLTRGTVQAISGDTAVVSSPMPTPWVEAAIGAEMPRGGAMYSNGTFTVSGGGPDIWNNSDGFHFVCQPWIGNGEIIAHVSSFEYDREPFSKAGIQFRESLDSAAKYVGLSLETDSLNRYVALLHYRKTFAGSSIVDGKANSTPAPAWVRLIRAGDTVTGLISLDGALWDTVAVGMVAMNAQVYAGLAVTSHDSERLSTAVFDHLSIH